jgi:hypothetical protein
MDQAAAKMAEINKLMEELQKKSAVSFSPGLHLVRNAYARCTWDIKVFSNFEKI